MAPRSRRRHHRSRPTLTLLAPIREVDELSDGTEVRITAEDVPDGISAEDHAEGLSSSLFNLAAYLEP